MPNHCKDLFLASIGEKQINEEELSQSELDFVHTKRTIQDFTIGLKIPGKLLPKTINGGVLLQETTYEMR